jgi:FAD/FMN-containing dehydrogenase
VDVSLGVLTLQVAQCEFAVKSGGHAAFAGASNIENGLTIDLINLNQITVSADQTQTSVGPGNVWYDVYSKLDPMGLSVIGGRVSAIGVGGLTLGGGISFFSGRYGWVRFLGVLLSLFCRLSRALGAKSAQRAYPKGCIITR